MNGDDSRPQASFKRNELLEPAKSEPVQERLIIDETSPVASSSDIGYNSFAEKHGMIIFRINRNKFFTTAEKRITIKAMTTTQ